MTNRILNGIRKGEILIVALTLITIYFSFLLYFGYLYDLNRIIFCTPDSQSYLDVAEWIMGIKDTNRTIIRPFFYPLILNLARSINNVYGIWSIHLILWVLSGVMIYVSVKKITNSIPFSIGGVFIFGSNLTIMLLTLHALSEITIIFLISSLILLITNKNELKENQYWLIFTLIVVLATVTKPVFIMVLIAVLIYRIPVIILTVNENKKKLKTLCWVIIVLSPILIQASIMKIKHNLFSLSAIGSITMEQYFYPRLYAKINKISIEESRERINLIEQKGLAEYSLKHFKETTQNYLEILAINLLSGSVYVDLPDSHPFLRIYMKVNNRIYFCLHILMFVPIIVKLFMLIKEKKYIYLEIIISLLIPMLIIIFSSGISFWQGDRLIVTSLPLWIVLYCYVMSDFLGNYHIIGKGIGREKIWRGAK